METVIYYEDESLKCCAEAQVLEPLPRPALCDFKQ